MKQRFVYWSIVFLQVAILHAVPEKGYILNVGRTSPTPAAPSSVSIIDTTVTPPAFISNNTYDVNFIKGTTPIPQAIAITPDGTKVYIANNKTNIVTVLSTATDEELSTIILAGVDPTLSLINSVAITPNGKKAYFTDGRNNRLIVIDVTNDTVLTYVPLPTLDFPTGIAIDKNGYVYVASYSNGYVNIVDSATDTEIVGSPIVSHITQPYAIAINSLGYAYITSSDSNLISIINTNTHTFFQTMSVTSLSGGTTGIAISESDIAYIANNSYKINVVNTVTNTETAVLNLNTNPVRPFGIGISPTTGYAYITNSGSNSISVLNTANNTEIAGSPFSSFSTTVPFSIAFIPPYVTPTPTPSEDSRQLLLKSKKYTNVKIQPEIVIN